MAIEGIGNAAAQGGAPVATPLAPRQETTPIALQQPVSPPYVVNLSPDALSRRLPGRNDGAVSSAGVSDNRGASGPGECQTCKNRRYVDRSNDATVSFQSPTRISPGAAEGAVRAHEQEHVSNEQATAVEQDRRVVYQAVSIQYAICPECGRSYVAGGTTTTVTKAETQPGVSPPAASKPAAGGMVDLTV